MGITLRNMASVFIVREGKVLLMYRVGSRAVPPSFVGVGGHFEPEELNDPKACVLREMHEEIGLLPQDLEEMRLRYIVLHRLENEVRQNYYYFAACKSSVDIPLVSDEGALSWHELSQVEELAMPLTAKSVLRHYRAEGQNGQALAIGVSGREGVVFSPLENVGRVL